MATVSGMGAWLHWAMAMSIFALASFGTDPARAEEAAAAGK
jgi:hypothetical protein